MTHEILTVNEVAELMRVSTDTIYRLAAAGELPGRKVGRAWRFSRLAVTRYLTGDPVTAPESTSDAVVDDPTRQQRRNRDTDNRSVVPDSSRTKETGHSDQRH